MGKIRANVENFQVDMEKMKNLIHHICARCDRPFLSKVRLNKILWFCDVEAYRRLGSPITGETYVKQKFGPVPSHVDEALRTLGEEGKLVEREAPSYDFTKKEFVSLKRPDVSGLTQQEIEIANEIASNLCDNLTTDEIIEISHGILWQTADMGEALPYECTLIESFSDPSLEHPEWVEKISRQLAGEMTSVNA
jgi:hypothetical protein